MNQNKPNLISFKKKGSEEKGFLSVAEFADSLPFPVKRIYWVYDTPTSVERGNHASKTNKQVVVCLKGKVYVKLESLKSQTFHYVLEDAGKGLLIPALHWRKIHFSEDAILIALCSEKFSESDYVRNYKEFTQLKYVKKSPLKTN